MNETEGLFKLTKDPRVTRAGQLLRKTSIDELTDLTRAIHDLTEQLHAKLLGPSATSGE